MSLVLLAHVFLAAVTAVERRDQAVEEPNLARMTMAEVQRLFTRLGTGPVRTMAFVVHWSRWRRRHQARAQASHYRRQAARET